MDFADQPDEVAIPTNNDSNSKQQQSMRRKKKKKKAGKDILRMFHKR